MDLEKYDANPSDRGYTEEEEQEIINALIQKQGMPKEIRLTPEGNLEKLADFILAMAGSSDLISEDTPQHRWTLEN